MVKPYLKRHSTVSGFVVWIVDGKYIRSVIDEEFTNFGQHYRFNFIPKNEFWVDKEYGDGGEIQFYIDHMLMEHRLMEKGMGYDQALKKADGLEKSERKKSSLMQEFGNYVIDRVHKRLLKHYSGKVKVWIVHGVLVRDLFFIDFTEGGHDMVYHFVPDNEVWIDDDVSPRERKYVILHEFHERNLMAKKMKQLKRSGKRLSHHQVYCWAHRQASELEYYCRHHPSETEKKIKEEAKKSV